VASSPATVRWLVDAFWANRPSLEDYLRHVVARQEHQTLDRLRDLDLPTLVLVGDRDTHQGGTGVHWEQSAALLERLPRAEQQVVAGAAHGYFWQLPEESARILLEWTGRQDAR
jgi:pimeloyl-ACP methyl ester carboxylesterase